MAISIVQSIGKAQTGIGTGSTTQAYTSNVTAGNTLIAIATTTNPAASVNFSDNLNGAWGSAILSSNASQFVSLFTKANTLGGACTVTYGFTPGSTATFLLFEVLGAIVLDKTAVAHNSSYAGAYVGPTVATTQPVELVIAGFSASSNATNGWTNTGTPTPTVVIAPNTPYNSLGAYWVTSATGTQSSAFSGATTAFESLIATWYSGGPQAPTTPKGYVSVRSTSQS